LMGFIDSTFICQIVFKRSNGIPDWKVSKLFEF
jgi:hypothetical protein